MVRAPVSSGISKRVNGYTSQGVRPFNRKFTRKLREPRFQPRAGVAAKSANTLAREILGMADDDFRSAFRDSPMKRAKVDGLRRNAAAVLGISGDKPKPT